MKLDNVVPFGRSLDEYRKMFTLSDADLERSIVGIGDGPASFNAEMFARGKPIISVDPLYVFSAEEIEKRFYAVVDNIIDQVKSTPGDWVWSHHHSPEHLRDNRVNVLRTFVTDYNQATSKDRYQCGELPTLDFQNGSFDLALCSHFLFLYSDQFSYEFHRSSALELLRVASEVRIFPLLTLSLKPSSHLQPLIETLTDDGFTVSVEKVAYELQRGGNEMLRIRHTNR